MILGWLHGGTILSIREHGAKGRKALERHWQNGRSRTRCGTAWGGQPILTRWQNMPPVLVSRYANLSLLFADFHAKIIPWGHESLDFVELGFDESGGVEDDEDVDMYLPVKLDNSYYCRYIEPSFLSYMYDNFYNRSSIMRTAVVVAVQQPLGISYTTISHALIYNYCSRVEHCTAGVWPKRLAPRK